MTVIDRHFVTSLFGVYQRPRPVLLPLPQLRSVRTRVMRFCSAFPKREFSKPRASRAISDTVTFSRVWMNSPIGSSHGSGSWRSAALTAKPAHTFGP